MINQKSDRPDLLDLNKTQQIIHKHNTLQNTIESTIQGLMKVYKQNQQQTGLKQEDKTIQNQVFDRLASIFSQMNEFKGQIDNTITFLNEGQRVYSSQRQCTPNKRSNKNEQIKQDVSQDCEYQEMENQNENQKDDKIEEKQQNQ